MNTLLIALGVIGSLAFVVLFFILLKRLGDPVRTSEELTEEQLTERFPKRRRTHPRRVKKDPRNKRILKRIKGNYSNRRNF